MVFEEGTTIAILTGYRDALEGYRSSIQDKLNDLQIAAEDLKLKKTAGLARVGEFNRKVRKSLLWYFSFLIGASADFGRSDREHVLAELSIFAAAVFRVAGRGEST